MPKSKSKKRSTSRTDLTLHPAAMLFPAMSRAEIDDLIEDVRTSKRLLEPITLDHTGTQIVDGRHRQIACVTAKVKPTYVRLKKHVNVVRFVVSKNLNRRNLTPSQRAAIAAELMAELKGVKNDTAKGKARTKAAKALHVSEGYVHEAAKLKQEDPEKFKDVKAGKLKLSKARPKKATPKKDKPPQKSVTLTTLDVEDDAPEQEPEPVEEASGPDEIFYAWEQALQHLNAYVSSIDNLMALADGIEELVAGTRAVQKLFARLRKASNGAVAVAP